MKKQSSTPNKLQEALAVLISSTRNKKRPMSLVDISMWLNTAVARLGSYSAVAERIGLSAKMLRQFSYVNRLNKSVQKLFKERKIDSVDAAVHLSALTDSEQYLVAKALANGEIDTSDVRAASQLRVSGDRQPIEELINRVKESKTKKEYIAEFVIRGSTDKELILSKFNKFIPKNEIARLDIEGAFGRIVLTKKGKQFLSKAAKKLNTPLRYVIGSILQG